MVRDLLGEGLAALNELRSASMVRTVTYQRGSDSVDVLATPGNMPPAEMLDDASPAWVQRYFKINTVDLVIDGVESTPQVGDLIIETMGDGSEATYAVQPPAGMPVFERVEDWRAFKVYTSRVDESAELVTYYPGGHLYDPRPMVAQVDRSAEAAIVVFGGDVRAPTVVFRIQRGTGDGRISEVKPGQDLVDVDLLRTGRMTRFRVDRIASSNPPGFWKLGALGGELVPQ